MGTTHAELEIELTPDLEQIVGVRYVYVDIAYARLEEWEEANSYCWDRIKAITEGYISFRVLEILELTLEDIEIYLHLTNLLEPDTLCLKDMLTDFLLAMRKKVVEALLKASIVNDLITIH